MICKGKMGGCLWDATSPVRPPHRLQAVEGCATTWLNSRHRLCIRLFLATNE
jgi:hypothetical protein